MVFTSNTTSDIFKIDGNIMTVGQTYEIWAGSAAGAECSIAVRNSTDTATGSSSHTANVTNIGTASITTSFDSSDPTAVTLDIVVTTGGTVMLSIT